MLDNAQCPATAERASLLLHCNAILIDIHTNHSDSNVSVHAINKMQPPAMPIASAGSEFEVEQQQLITLASMLQTRALQSRPSAPHRYSSVKSAQMHPRQQPPHPLVGAISDWSRLHHMPAQADSGQANSGMSPSTSHSQHTASPPSTGPIPLQTTASEARSQRRGPAMSEPRVAHTAAQRTAQVARPNQVCRAVTHSMLPPEVGVNTHRPPWQSVAQLPDLTPRPPTDAPADYLTVSSQSTQQQPCYQPSSRLCPSVLQPRLSPQPASPYSTEQPCSPLSHCRLALRPIACSPDAQPATCGPSFHSPPYTGPSAKLQQQQHSDTLMQDAGQHLPANSTAKQPGILPGLKFSATAGPARHVLQSGKLGGKRTLGHDVSQPNPRQPRTSARLGQKRKMAGAHREPAARPSDTHLGSNGRPLFMLAVTA